MPSSFAVVPDWGTQLAVVVQSSVNAAAAGAAKLVKVEFPGVVKSTWKW